MPSTTILVIDDSQSAAQAVCNALESHDPDYQAIHSPSGLDGFKTLIAKNIDLVLCDLNMDGIDGFKFLGLKASRPELIDVPVIMLTSSSAVSEKVKALEGGAADYLTKPFDDAELIARVHVHLKVRTLQRELREKNERLEELSNTDELTKLRNRRHFMRVAAVELLRAERYQQPLSCILLDLDHFKKINDNYGHLAGDEVLRKAAGAILNELRQHDIAARYGGEELILLLPHTPLSGAQIAAERYRKRIRELEIHHENKRINVTVSSGVASYPHTTQGTLEELIEAADIALYEAKKSGRDRVCLATPAS